MEIVETLRVVLAHHRLSTQNGNTVSDAMQVDSELPPSEPQPASDPNTVIPTPMPLATYLHLMMNYPTTRGPLLLSFRRHLQDPEDITTLLQILSNWFTQRNKMAADVGCRIPGPKDIKKTTEGVWIIVGRRNAKPKQETIPSLEKVQVVSLSIESYLIKPPLPDRKPHLNLARLLFPFPLAL